MDRKNRDDIKSEFEGIHNRLNKLDVAYNPQHKNLHFDCLERVDTNLYTELLQLAAEGLKRVKEHRDYFLEKGLYDDGMFWYNLCLMISAAASRVLTDGTQNQIPEHLVVGLAETLIEISEYAIGCGDMDKRVYEALVNTLWAFNSEELIQQAQQKSHTINQNNVMHFVDNIILRVVELKKVS
jgi:hypothetical protein